MCKYAPLATNRRPRTLLALVVFSVSCMTGCVSRDDVVQLNESVKSLDESVTELDQTVQALRQPVVVAAVPECGPPGLEKKIDLKIRFIETGECLYPLDVVSDDNGCIEKTESNIACVCRGKVPKTKITWQAVDSSGKAELDHDYRVYFGPLFLESDNQGRIKDNTVSSDAPLGPHKYSIVSGSCELDPHLIIGQ